MKSIFKAMGVLGVTLSLVGCDELRGRIDVREPLQLNVVKGNKVLPPGSYDSKLTISVKKKKYKARIEISVSGKKNNPIVDIPLSGAPVDGPIALRAQDIGQNFGVLGQARTDVSNSGLVNTTESCSVSVPHQKCTVTPEGRKVCTTEILNIPGRENVEYYDQYTTRTVDLDLVSSLEEARVLASSHNARTDSRRIYTFRGGCIVHGMDPVWSLN